MRSNKSEAIQSIESIKNMMERSSKFLSLSGLSGIFAGVFALLGAAAAYRILNWGNRRFVDYGSIRYSPVDNFRLWLLLDGVLILVLSVSVAYYFTRKKSKRLGLKMWDSVAKRMFVNFITPLLTGGIFTLIIILKYDLIYLIAPLTLIFYGLALISASKYSFDELRWLGFSEVILGLIATYFIGYGLLFWSIGFGVLHIIYGIVLFKKHE